MVPVKESDDIYTMVSPLSKNKIAPLTILILLQLNPLDLCPTIPIALHLLHAVLEAEAQHGE